MRLYLNLEKSLAAAEKGGRWYEKYVQNGAKWVTIKNEGPLHGRHILIDGHGYIVGGSGIPKRILDKLNGGHISVHGPYEEVPKAPGGLFDHENKPPKPEAPKEEPKAPEPPKEEPKAPEPPKEEPKPEKPKSAKPAKMGYGDDATMYVQGPKTFNHLKNLKHAHGGAWNGEHSRWEYKHAPGSEEHKKLKEYVDKYQGIDLHEINSPKFADVTVPGAKEDKGAVPIPKPEEPKKLTAEDAKTREVPDKEIAEHLQKNRGLSKEDAQDADRLQSIQSALKELRENPHLHKHFDEHTNSLGKIYKAKGVDPFEHAERLVAGAKNRHDLANGKTPEPKPDPKFEQVKNAKQLDQSEWATNTPSMDRLKEHFIAAERDSRARTRGTDKDIHIRTIDPTSPYYQSLAAEAHSALEEIHKNPALIPHVQQELNYQKKLHGRMGEPFDSLSYLHDAVEAARPKLSERMHTTKEGTSLSINPEKPRLVRLKGVRNMSNYAHVVKTSDGRERYIPIPKDNKPITKEHIAKYAEGLGDEAHSFLHHVISGNKEPFSYSGGSKTKATTEYKPFEAPPEKKGKTKEYLENAKDDMMAHGARAVVYHNTGTAEQRAKTTHVVATGMRALHHLTGGGAPDVELVIGGTKGSTLAHYRAGYRSITIDPEKGRNSFVHEYGHFLDDALHGFKTFHGPDSHLDRETGRYKKGAALKEIGDELRNTQAAKDKMKKWDDTRQSAQFKKYYDADHERFARFFSQWVPHEAKKQGFDLPEELYNPHERLNNNHYGEHYTDEQLDSIGEKLKKVLKSKGLWKGFLQFLQVLGGRRAPLLYINRKAQ